MKTKYLIGLDFGSDSVRCLIVNAETGETLSSAVEDYARWAEGKYCDASENRYRQHPLDHLEAMEKCIRTSLDRCSPEIAENIAGIGYDTTASTPALIDRCGTPLALRPEFSDNPDAMFVLWKDHTAIKESDEINAAVKNAPVDYTKYCGGSYSCEWAWAKMLHCLRSSPELKDAAWSWAEHCDWIGSVLTGNMSAQTMQRSRCCAGHKAMWNMEWGGLPDIGFFKGIDPLYSVFEGHMYTGTLTSDACIGTLSEEWKARLGLKERISVAMGAIDCHMGAVGAGIRPGTLVKVMGTSTCDIMTADTETSGGTVIRGICGQVDGSVLPGYTGYEAGQAAFGDLYAWFRRLLGWPLRLIGDNDKAAMSVEKNLLDLLTEEASMISPAPEDPVSIDWINGRRTPDLDPNAKGALTGISLGTSAPQVFKSLVEATAFGARAINERIENEGIEIQKIIATGGIAKKSPYVMQTLADVLGKEILVADNDQTCALGAAIFAASAAGIYGSIEEAQRHMASSTASAYAPDMHRHAIYDILYSRYLALGKRL